MRDGRIFFLKELTKDEFLEIINGNITEFFKYVLPIISVNKKTVKTHFNNSGKVLFKSRFEEGKYFTYNRNLLKNRYKEFTDFEE